jgi:hypothetical protein
VGNTSALRPWCYHWCHDSLANSNNLLGIPNTVLEVHGNLRSKFPGSKFHTLTIDIFSDAKTQFLSFIFQFPVLHLLIDKKMIKRLDFSVINQFDEFLVTFIK